MILDCLCIACWLFIGFYNLKPKYQNLRFWKKYDNVIAKQALVNIRYDFFSTASMLTMIIVLLLEDVFCK